MMVFLLWAISAWIASGLIAKQLLFWLSNPEDSKAGREVLRQEPWVVSVTAAGLGPLLLLCITIGWLLWAVFWIGDAVEGWLKKDR